MKDITNKFEADGLDGTCPRLPHIFQKGDVLVINETKVIPAKIVGKKDTGSLVLDTQC
jgi:S-adenosylmethionine:tRNA-ribosyltransferase-isomerase (queuine synthetase)